MSRIIFIWYSPPYDLAAKMPDKHPTKIPILIPTDTTIKKKHASGETSEETF